MGVSPIPKGFNSVSAYLVVKDARAAIAFYQKAFGAKPGDLMNGPDGESVMHAEIHIGNSAVMLTQENPQWEMKSAETLGGSPISMHIYSEDCDALFNKAMEAGCKEVAPLMDAFWGDRYGKLQDPFGIQWGIATHKEDLSPEEVAKRGAEWMAQMGSECDGKA